ncbi:MAG: methyltransferase domain-containing protein [Dehalococcoidia bacterium]
MQDLHAAFQDVTQSMQPEALVRFLDAADQNDSVQAGKRTLTRLLEPVDGQEILDVGCGLGHDVRRLAREVGPRGRVVGVDKSEVMIAEARRRTAGDMPVAYHVGDATRLAFAGRTFDRCRAERVLMYLPDPAQAIAELVRVLRPGGRLALFELDYGAVLLDAPDLDLTRRLETRFAESAPSGLLGRQLPRLLRTAGMVDVSVVPHAYMVPLSVYQQVAAGPVAKAVTDGIVAADEVARWWQQVRATEEAGLFFMAFIGFAAAGRVPTEPAL